jgi:Holliday junction DNA helicase RuvA
MISLIKGRLFDLGDDSVVVDTGGVGYEILVHARTRSRLPALGESVLLFTHLQVLENEFKLYGFLERQELALFKRLLGVSGMGARSALNLLENVEPGQFYRAIASEDEKFLVKIPGVGKKTAQRLIFELKDRLGDQVILSTAEGSTGGGDDLGELLEALEALGYARNEIFPLVMNLQQEGRLPGRLEEKIRTVLQFRAGQMSR